MLLWNIWLVKPKPASDCAVIVVKILHEEQRQGSGFKTASPEKKHFWHKKKKKKKETLSASCRVMSRHVTSRPRSSKRFGAVIRAIMKGIKTTWVCTNRKIINHEVAWYDMTQSGAATPKLSIFQKQHILNCVIVNNHKKKKKTTRLETPSVKVTETFTISINEISLSLLSRGGVY